MAADHHHPCPLNVRFYLTASKFCVLQDTGIRSLGPYLYSCRDHKNREYGTSNKFQV